MIELKPQANRGFGVSNQESSTPGVKQWDIVWCRIKDWALPVGAAVLAAGLGVASITGGLADRDGKGPGSCSSPGRTGTASYRPSGALFGVNLNLGAKPLAQYAADLGRKQAVSVSFAESPYTDQERTHLQLAAAQIRADGHMMLLTLEPKQGLTAVTLDVISALVQNLSAMKNQGVPVIVRLAHEMNASWYPWSQEALEYKKVFTQVAEAVHRDAPGSAMM